MASRLFWLLYLAHFFIRASQSLYPPDDYEAYTDGAAIY